MNLRRNVLPSHPAFASGEGRNKNMGMHLGCSAKLRPTAARLRNVPPRPSGCAGHAGLSALRPHTPTSTQRRAERARQWPGPPVRAGRACVPLAQTRESFGASTLHFGAGALRFSAGVKTFRRERAVLWRRRATLQRECENLSAQVRDRLARVRDRLARVRDRLARARDRLARM